MFCLSWASPPSSLLDLAIPPFTLGSWHTLPTNCQNGKVPPSLRMGLPPLYSLAWSVFHSVRPRFVPITVLGLRIHYLFYCITSTPSFTSCSLQCKQNLFRQKIVLFSFRQKNGFIPSKDCFIPSKDIFSYLFSTLDLRGFELILTQNRLAKMNVFASELKIG